MEGGWCGTVWKAFVRIRSERDDLEMFVVDTDHGVGVLKSNGKQKKLQCPEDIYTYNVFNQYRKEILNLISVEEFKKREINNENEEFVPILQKGIGNGLQKYVNDIDTLNPLTTIELLAKTFSKVNDMVKLSGVVLDVGCGNGRLNAIYKNYFNRIVGIDKFRQPNKIYQYPNFEYRNFDIFECNENNEFDIISFVGSFYIHCNYGKEGYLKTLNKSKKLLKDGGYIIIVEDKNSNKNSLENKDGNYNLENLCLQSKLEIVNSIIHEHYLLFYIIRKAK
jgi:SAM-dependent methyltransferase